MANTNAPYGFIPVGHMSGGTIRHTAFRIASAASGNIFTGDVVKAANTGTILVAAAGDRALGIFAGCQWTDTDGTIRFSQYWPTATATLGSVDATGYVYTDRNIIFKVQSGGTPGVTNIFNLADHVVGTGSTVTGKSGASLSGTMAADTASFRILGFSTEPSNEIGQYADLLVQLYESELTDAFYNAAIGGSPGV